MKRGFKIALAAMTAAALAAGVAQAQMKTIAIGTGGTGGVYYPIGGALANLLSKNMPNMPQEARMPVWVGFSLRDFISSGAATPKTAAS